MTIEDEITGLIIVIGGGILTILSIIYAFDVIGYCNSIIGKCERISEIYSPREEAHDDR
jgi:hypothetical protein